MAEREEPWKSRCVNIYMQSFEHGLGKKIPPSRVRVGGLTDLRIRFIEKGADCLRNSLVMKSFSAQSEDDG